VEIVTDFDVDDGNLFGRPVNLTPHLGFLPIPGAAICHPTSSLILSHHLNHAATTSHDSQSSRYSATGVQHFKRYSLRLCTHRRSWSQRWASEWESVHSISHKDRAGPKTCKDWPRDHWSRFFRSSKMGASSKLSRL